MIDLSYLTEQEQEMIKAVLKRDAALKRVEEERVKKLQKSLRDRSKLKYLTGEWFYETKSRRHRDRIHGSDIIRASLTQKKPITLLELNHMWEETPSFVNSRNKEVFVPAELSGLLEEPATQPQEPRDSVFRKKISLVSEVQPEQRKPAVPATEKVEAKAVMETDGPVTNGAVGMAQRSEGDKHEHHVESYPPQVSDLHTSINKKGKGDHTRVGSHGHSTRLAFQSLELTEEENECITKVLEWFNWSSNSSSSYSDEENQQPFQQDLEEARQHLRIPFDAKTQFIPADVTDLTMHLPVNYTSGVLEEKAKAERLCKAEIFYTEDVSVMANCDSQCLHTELVCQPKGCIIAVEEMQKSVEKSEGKQTINEGVNDEDFTSAAVTKVQKDVKSKEVQEAESQHILATVTSFWDRGNKSPKVLISKTTTGSKTMERAEPAYLSELVQKEIDIDQQALCTSGKISPPSEKYISTDSRRGIKKIDVLPPQATSRRIYADAKEYFDQVHVEMEHLVSVKEGQHINPQGSVAGFALNTIFMDMNSHSVHSSCLSERQNEDKLGYDEKSVIFQGNASSSTQDVTHNSWASHQKEDPRLLSLSKDPATAQSSQESLKRPASYLQPNLKGKKGQLKSFWEKNKNDPRIIDGHSKDYSKNKSIDQYTGSSCPVMNKSSAASNFELEATDKTLDSDEASSSHYTVKPIAQPTDEQSSMNSDLRNHCNFRTLTASVEDCLFSIKNDSLGSEDRPQSWNSPRENCQKSHSFLPFSNLPGVEMKMSSSPNNSSKILSSKSEAAVDTSATSKDTCTYQRKTGNEKQSAFSVTEKRESYDKELARTGITKPNVETEANLPQPRNEPSEQHGLTWPQNAKQTTIGEQAASKSLITSKHKKCHHQRAKRTGVENLEREKQCTSMTEREHMGTPKGFRRQHKRSQSGEQTAYSKTCERKFPRSSEEGRSQHTLARSFIPFDYQHYLGISNRTSVDKKNTVKGVGSRKIASEVRPLPEPSRVSPHVSPPKYFGDGCRRSSNEDCTSQYSHRVAGTFDSSRSRAPHIWSHSLASSPCDGEDSDPVRTTLKQVTSRPVSVSKSLEDIKSLLTLSTAPATLPSSFSDPEQMKRMSMSVPAFVLEENGGRDNDSEYSGRSEGQRKTGGSFTNLSASSGVVSVSSEVSGSVMSIYSGEFSSVEVKGTIQFAISYVQKLSEMHIIVVQCRNLAVADIRKNRSDPYVKCYLLPDKAKLGKRKTSVKKKTVNPTYNEILRYKVDLEILRSQTLNLSVWHNDTFGRNSFMGEVEVDFSKWNFSNTQTKDYTLKPRAVSGMQPVEHRGEMRLALRFLPQISPGKQSSKTGELQIWVKDCRNLPAIRGAAIDPFVKCAVLPDNSKKSRQKTQVLRRTANPHFNHTVVYDGFGPEDLRETCVELTVWDHDRLSNHFLGGLRLGLGTGKSYGAPVDWMDSNADEVTLWDQMMDRQHEWVEDVLPLRMLMMARSMSK